MFNFNLGVIGVKLYSNSQVECVDQEDIRVMSKKTSITTDHLSELEKIKGASVHGQILYFPEDGYYAYTKCTSCKATAPIKDNSVLEFCQIENCGGRIYNIPHIFHIPLQI